MRFPNPNRTAVTAAAIALVLTFAHANVEAAGADAKSKPAASTAADCAKVQKPARTDHSDPHGVKATGDCAKAPAPKLAQLRTSDITYPNGDRTARKDVDLTHYENIFGHIDSKDEVLAWPGRQGAVASIAALPRNGFVCAAFTIPAKSRYFGTIGVGSHYSTPDAAVDMAYSDACGDFAPKQKACLKLDVANGESGPRWTTIDNVKGCALKPGTHYWNLRIHAHGEGTRAVTLTNSFAQPKVPTKK